MGFSTTTNPSQTSPTARRIVAIGASAGGFKPLEAFLRQTPADTGMAFSIVQHLDPNQKTLLPELLQRATSMPVQEAQQHMRIEPDHIYVIPPNTELRVVDGHLELKRPVEPRGMRLPVDVLFSSLASSMGDRAIAVVLSGMGQDGTLGLQAIKAVGGLSAAQDPQSAQFDSMPSHAINSTLVDIVADPAALPDRILSYVRGLPEPLDPRAEVALGTPEIGSPQERIIELHVRRFTDRASSLVNVRDSDIGRPLSDLTTSLNYPNLHEDARQTLESLRPSEKQIQNNDGRWFSVRIMPYRRLNNLIDGVVITLFDITTTKNLEAALRESAGE